MEKAKKKRSPVGRIICVVVIAIVLAALIVADVMCATYEQVITTMLCGSGVDFSDEKTQEVLAGSDKVLQNMEDEGIVLVKNEGGALPLGEDELKVNLLGWSAHDEAFFLTGGGSSTATIHENKKVSLADGLEAEGIAVNRDLLADYVAYRGTRWNRNYDLPEPSLSFYNETGTNTGDGTKLDHAKKFSDIAVVVLSRYGSEGTDIPLEQTKYVDRQETTDSSRTYMDLTTEEEALIDMAGENFSKVIVLVNSGNVMNLDYLDGDAVDAALVVGYPGQSGTKSIARVLKGSVNPSGRLTDTYTRDPESDPSFANALKTQSTEGDHIHYTEDIYIGYKWYETADAEGYFEAVGTTYDESVQYPFGYGMSYASFSQRITDYSLSTTGSGLLRATQVTVTVEVTNTHASRSGKDVIQLYCNPPYYDSGIEKPHVMLAAFAKTDMLAPGETKSYELSFRSYDLASYDAYDADGDGRTGFILEDGEYRIFLLGNAHGWKNLSENDGNTITLTAENAVQYKRDPDTGAMVKNRFGMFDADGGYLSGSAYADVPIDGSTAGVPVVYMSRADFVGTFPHDTTPIRDITETVSAANNYVERDAYAAYTSAPEQGMDGDLTLTVTESGDKPSAGSLNSGAGLEYNDGLMQALGADYNEPRWESLLSQLTLDEILDFVESSGYGTDAAPSVGKPAMTEIDGPSGFNIGVNSPLGDPRSEWTGFCNQMVLGQSWNTDLAFEFGSALATEGLQTGVSAIYAPGVNLHRSPFNGRNFEYYSEDPVLSGYMAADVIIGAKTHGMRMYLKHFVVSEMGPNPRRLNVWLTEQNLRENYLRPFEIAVKAGANSVMSAFNRLGGTWTGGNYALLTEILRGEWKFRGAVITDWSRGEADMPVEQGIRAGNDIWLNPTAECSNGLDTDDPASLTLGRRAAKNLLYSICNTYYAARTYDPEASLAVSEQGDVFRWWILVLVLMNVAVVAAAALSAYRVFRGKKKRAAAGDVPPTDGGDTPNSDDKTELLYDAAAAVSQTAEAMPSAVEEVPSSGKSPAVGAFAAEETDAENAGEIPSAYNAAAHFGTAVGFAEAYGDMAEEDKARFDRVKNYALSVPGAVEKAGSGGVIVKANGKKILRLKVRRGKAVAYFDIESDALREYRRESGIRIPHTETAMKLTDDESVTAACRMVDIMVEQGEKEREEVRERRREARRKRRENPDNGDTDGKND